jgi:hypothetical protein
MRCSAICQNLDACHKQAKSDSKFCAQHSEIMSTPYIKKTFALPYLYHTTQFNDGTWDIEEFEHLPPLGTWGNDMVHPKYFTITPMANYAGSEKPFIFLRYSVKRPLRLIQAKQLFNPPSDSVIEEYDADGYIGLEDVHELYLLRPNDVISLYPLPLPVPIVNVVGEWELLIRSIEVTYLSTVNKNKFPVEPLTVGKPDQHKTHGFDHYPPNTYTVFQYMYYIHPDELFTLFNNGTQLRNIYNYCASRFHSRPKIRLGNCSKY